MAIIDTLVFDLGNVLIDWNPHHLYTRLLPAEQERNWFLSNICTMDWNEEQDGGRSLREGTDLLVGKFPEHESSIRAYYDRWEEMLGDPLSGTVELFRQLKARGDLRFYALTNWSAETFPIALKKYDFLHWFDGRVVSGEEKTRKPFAKMYQTLIDRYAIDPARAVFVDDNARNIVAAKELGFHTVHFKSPGQLQEELALLGVLAGSNAL